MPDFQISRKLAALNFSVKLGAFRRQSTEKSSPPNFTEVTECRRIKFFSANLAVFGVSRREFLLFLYRFHFKET
jgi:hypothetical protein